MHSCANEEWPRLFILFHEITPRCLLLVYYARNETVVSVSSSVLIRGHNGEMVLSLQCSYNGVD